MKAWATALLLFLAAGLAGAARAAEPTLEARALLDADTLAAGPQSGAGATPANGRTPPFASQPVQGFSAVLDAGGGAYWAMPDNGYGLKTNSSDFLLRMYRVRPSFETASGGSGSIVVEAFIELRDPDDHVPFPIQNEGTAPRGLTGADFDIESVRGDASGDLWFGDEFGPFLLHTDSTGKLLEAPIALPGVEAPEAPGNSPNLASSRGFEGMGNSAGGPCGADAAPERIYPMLEGPVSGDDSRTRRIYSFSLTTGSYGPGFWRYRTEDPSHSIGELANIDAHRQLVIERDNSEGASANFKRVYLVDLRRTDADGYLVKAELMNLMAIRDPALISHPADPDDIGLGDPFSFPFFTIEALLPLDRERLLVMQDNNYPSSNGRHPGAPDDNEAIVVRIDALCAAPAVQQPPGLAPAFQQLVDATAPSVRSLRALRRRFRVGRRPTPLSARRAPVGTTFSYSISEPSSVRIRLDAELPGRKVGRRCLPARRGSRGRRCTRLRRMGTLTRRRLLARGSLSFSGRLGRRALRPGPHRARLVAVDAFGNRSRPRAVAFRVVR